ncbi:MAG: DNA polymerase [Candidatus Dadabacteria bacterium]|nr:MAG: DNA polymerase [Candidatus Dadabacteria bacterium]
MEKGKLDWLFLDMNSYFASVEQELRPELRGLATVVVSVMADTTCCIAASYEAKKYGIKTGTKVAIAKKLCGTLNIIESRPTLYIKYHKDIVSAVGSILPIDKVHSIDEMSCKLTGRQRVYDNAVSLAHEVKKAIKERVGEYLRCSIGLAPNRFIAKIASGMKKPDGFTVITKDDLPQILYPLSLRDLPGIGRNMHARLRKHNIHNVEDLYSLSGDRFLNIWQNVGGKRLSYLLNGEEIAEQDTKRRTVSHSHVMAPEMRTEERTRAVLIRLIHKAAFRLRRLKYLAGNMSIKVKYFNSKNSWKRSLNIGKRHDTQSMIRAFSEIWEERPRGFTPLSASVTLSELIPINESSYSLFPDQLKQDKLATALDKINERYGMNSIYFGSMHDASESAPLRIAFTSIPDVVAEGTKSERSTMSESK